MNVLRTLLLTMLFVSPLLAEKFPAQVKKSITFVFSKDTNNRLVLQGTGFFVLMKTSQSSDTASFGYLVTSKSVLKRTDGRYLDTVYVRINRKDGYSDSLIVQLTVDGVPRYFLHPDSTIDLAVIPAFPDVNRYDVLYIPSGMIAAGDVFTRENIAEGNEVFTIGAMASHIGVFKNFPAVRYGRIAQMSDEKYQWGKTYTEFYLIESDLSLGSTGAPVYYYSGPVRDSAGTVRQGKMLLFGVVCGDYGTPGGPSGLVRVTPGYKLNELLNQPAVAAEREKEFARLRKEKNK